MVGQRDGQARQQRRGQGVPGAQDGPLDVLTIPQFQLRHRVVAGVYRPVFQHARLGVYLPLAHQVAAVVGGQYLDGDVGQGFDTAAAYNVSALVEDDDYIRLRGALQFPRQDSGHLVVELGQVVSSSPFR